MLHYIDMCIYMIDAETLSHNLIIRLSLILLMLGLCTQKRIKQAHPGGNGPQRAPTSLINSHTGIVPFIGDFPIESSIYRTVSHEDLHLEDLGLLGFMPHYACESIWKVIPRTVILLKSLENPR